MEAEEKRGTCKTRDKGMEEAEELTDRNADTNTDREIGEEDFNQTEKPSFECVAVIQQYCNKGKWKNSGTGERQYILPVSIYKCIYVNVFMYVYVYVYKCMSMQHMSRFKL